MSVRAQSVRFTRARDRAQQGSVRAGVEVRQVPDGRDHCSAMRIGMRWMKQCAKCCDRDVLNSMLVVLFESVHHLCYPWMRLVVARHA